MNEVIAFLDCKYGSNNSKKIDCLNCMIVYLLNERKDFEDITLFVKVLEYYNKRAFKPQVKKIFIEGDDSNDR